ncbi:phosphonate ABC transporter, permease protein PhnE [Anabaena cylindrica FACHB-243]|uniref:Phosphonate ABC transporter, inner membrane subunit n=1 Tax=Anabaena cylindrica (strain ATCC 27899 / PCC 7122) TaxID=272123 RepID=K9ZFX4_ANACC|nr:MULTISPECIES: phosphonate ABC transporter, permease protein PhnE [Anabaena]AFZ58123.1 phosphonate ABC transporter, inner membrane subunit [Anabaena cylindrica PCC 7122]MBD2419102.1 phosphonate ABC transporter, permease protein PhnE [Anabaena cylindrica FACHB-243]MBY5280689.1 phosphonate ABC transporter, permease protein PhnE [Anabaena sp. CCAP 1446/1C]MBY5310599.1 phosphonate ABC transporter, permease protein PhnE [Anabaena sp. CCAP 1446/1C]MCM2409572.1 phosphonate ABC transporter, permease
MSKSFNSPFLHRHPWVMPLLIILIMLGVYTWALQGLKVDFELLQNSWPYITDFIVRLFPPDWKVVDIAIKALIETIQMSLWGTSIGAILSLPIAVASSNNVAPLWLRWLANLLQNSVRSVPSIILGLIFVAATGLGAPAGTLALSIYTIGYLAKFYQQAIESVDSRSLESLQVIGASRMQMAHYGILPQVLPLGLGYTLWMFEYNIRAASVLGVVGAGGIGFQLKSYIDGFEYNKATTMMLVLLVVVTVIDIFSSKLRRHLDSM